MDIPDSWTPTFESIDNLPSGLRRYIHELQIKNDLAGMIRENFRLHQEIEALRKDNRKSNE
jgi:regulator of replication initiation timing